MLKEETPAFPRLLVKVSSLCWGSDSADTGPGAGPRGWLGCAAEADRESWEVNVDTWLVKWVIWLTIPWLLRESLRIHSWCPSNMPWLVTASWIATKPAADSWSVSAVSTKARSFCYVQQILDSKARLTKSLQCTTEGCSLFKTSVSK